MQLPPRRRPCGRAPSRCAVTLSCDMRALMRRSPTGGSCACCSSSTRPSDCAYDRRRSPSGFRRGTAHGWIRPCSRTASRACLVGCDRAGARRKPRCFRAGVAAQPLHVRRYARRWPHRRAARAARRARSRARRARRAAIPAIRAALDRLAAELEDGPRRVTAARRPGARARRARGAARRRAGVHVVAQRAHPALGTRR